MIKLTDEIIKNYQVRKTKKQKTEFIELLRVHFPEMRIESGGFLKCRNLVIGDVESAKVVFGAHYDTAAAWFLFAWLLIGGRANRHTMNDNTSGVVTLCEAIECMGPERRRDAAFVLYGSALRDAFPGMEGKCVRFERSATTLCPSDQVRFPCSAAAIALKKKRFLGLYLDRIHTKRDTVFQEENISYFTESICRLCDIMGEKEEEYEKSN